MQWCLQPMKLLDYFLFPTIIIDLNVIVFAIFFIIIKCLHLIVLSRPLLFELNAGCSMGNESRANGLEPLVDFAVESFGAALK